MVGGGKSLVGKLQDKVDGNKMDLSLMNLSEVPIREMRPWTRITQLDLSNNQLTELSIDFGPTFSTLTFLDLSKNRLTSLPENIGVMTKLVHLDLYKNEITKLPLSMGNMGKLQWLDLKDNPLVETLAKVCGNCSNKAECQKSARSLVLFMNELDKHIKAKDAQPQNELPIDQNTSESEDLTHLSKPSGGMNQPFSKRTKNVSDSDDSDDTTTSRSKTRRHAKPSKKSKSKKKSSEQKSKIENEAPPIPVPLPSRAVSSVGSSFSCTSIFLMLIRRILFALTLIFCSTVLLALMVDNKSLQFFLSTKLQLPELATVMVPLHAGAQECIKRSTQETLDLFSLYEVQLKSQWTVINELWKTLFG